MKLIISILFVLMLFSCGKIGTEETNYQKISKYEEEICDCFEKYNNDEDEIMKCFELQDKYWNEIKDSLDRINFLTETYKCIN